MIAIDSGVLIAIYRNGDEYHERAVELAKEHESENKVCTTGVFQEVIEYIRRADGNSKAAQIAGEMLVTQRLDVEPPDKQELIRAIEVMRQTKELSFCDALTASMAQSRGIKHILSFDSDFDRLPAITRIY